MVKEAAINFKIELDKDNIPDKIQWSATDASSKEQMEAKAIMISVWDDKKKESLGIDLWVKSTLIGDMNAFFYHTFARMSEAYERSTQNKKIAKMILQFSENFANEVEKEAKKEVKQKKKDL